MTSDFDDNVHMYLNGFISDYNSYNEERYI